MGDSWEDWDDEAPVVIPGASQPDVNAKFADEEDVEERKWESGPKTQPKPKTSKYDESRGLPASSSDVPLEDEAAERLRRQRLVEEADYAHTMDLFKGSERELEGFLPKGAKDFEEYAALVANKYLLAHAGSSHYKLLVKHLLRHALRPMSAQEVKDVESSVAGLRSEKLKEEKAAAAKNKPGKKVTLNVGRGGGSAGLDDYVFDGIGIDDDYDFM
ncbi:translation initiation factor 3 eIF3 [Helicosporidium sp. ATCC 50920]|nr:translation initiation factor 3 eIF3 [Helicosporidium sp. ATCC 50920]|eukprot:KDD75338.1 translation initiation factor 3 eIF3 [Helicosporidium sp. ATCC 50920]